ncbi:putative galactokinase [Desulfamplus magnetovallimortis]|uniref:Putative galactokinase n=1 Tax=Desulfamplus magnetovallimortis TaxID=1246637 RepID=L0R407_9BACT|nr:galactokinase [Desulfamplus magnetovallimortis]CCO06614.1 putative galactokinase [Desulfamplus magnetovallimortis BW-1]SLM32665.1 putative galactokinase [Desulfamplus magnetovallimortis]
MNFRKILEKQPVKASVPCRIDLGGTLDISTFFLPLAHLDPATFNIALNMRTTVTLYPWKDNHIKITSRGFEGAEFEAELAPFKHSMGLMFAVVRYFNGHGVHVHIESASPPRSALGGSSAAAVAMIGAFLTAMGKNVEPSHAALLAHYIESSVAGVPCGLQDQLAAAWGGINFWHWTMDSRGVQFIRENISEGASEGYSCDDINNHILVAYCGIPHVSSDINKRWVNRFLSGEDRDKWRDIINITHMFVDAFKNRNYSRAAELMNKETRIRMEMTPDVLDHTGRQFFEAASKRECGARFTGAGGGGCLWAIGESESIQALKEEWKDITHTKYNTKDNTPQSSSNDEEIGGLLYTAIDFQGILTDF